MIYTLNVTGLMESPNSNNRNELLEVYNQLSDISETPVIWYRYNIKLMKNFNKYGIRGGNIDFSKVTENYIIVYHYDIFDDVADIVSVLDFCVKNNKNVILPVSNRNNIVDSKLKTISKLIKPVPLRADTLCSVKESDWKYNIEPLDLKKLVRDIKLERLLG